MEKVLIVFLVLSLAVALYMRRRNKKKSTQVQLTFVRSGATASEQTIVAIRDDVCFIPRGSDILRQLRIGPEEKTGTLVIRRAPKGAAPPPAAEWIDVDYVRAVIV